MPPKRGRSTRASARKNAAADPAPPSSEDAKPNKDELDADVEAGVVAEPSSDLTELTSGDVKYENEPHPAAQEQPGSEEHLDSQPAPQSDTPLPGPSGSLPESEPVPNEGAPEASASTSTAHPRRLDSLGPSRGRGKRAVAAPRFAGRRAQNKREQLQKEEEQRKADEAKAAEEAARMQREAERRQASSQRGRGSGRGRGRGLGGHGASDRQNEPVASGPFSAGQVSKEIQEKNRRWAHRGSGWKGLHPGGRSDKAKGKAAQSDQSKPKLDANGDVSMEDDQDDYEYASSEDEELNGQRRVNVEKLGVIDLTGDDDDIIPYAPIRVARVPHKERRFGVRDDRAIKQEEDAAIKVDTIDGDDNLQANDKQQDRAVEVISETHGFQAVYSDSDTESKPHIKPEPGLEVGNDVASDRPASPETRRKGKERVRPRTTSTASIEEYDEEIEILREEEQRRRKDLDTIRDELGELDDGGDTVLNERRTDKVYLFQFPPILPDLKPVYVKPDPEAANDMEPEDGDLMQVDGPSNTGNPIEVNEDGNQPKLAPGAVGKMKVHKSGKVILDWGGMSLVLGMGGKADFLQNVVSTTMPDQKVDSKDDDFIAAAGEQGQVVNLGHVKEKFVLTPDWEELLG